MHARADPAALERAASLWTAALIREWFGRDRERLFWYVPQVGCFAPGAILVGDVEWPVGAGG